MFCPGKLEAEEEKDDERRKELSGTEKSNARIVNCAFWNSLAS